MPQIGKPSKPAPQQLAAMPEKPQMVTAPNKGKKSSSKNGSSTKSQKQTPIERPIKYPELKIAKRYTGAPSGPITYEEMKEFLGWETEAEYRARRLREDPTLTHAFLDEVAFGEEYLLLDIAGQKVRCWNNSIYSVEGKLMATNRPFDESHCKKLCQAILNRQWAGPTCFGPQETVNGEMTIIGRTGMVLSGQHRGIGLMLAVERWRSEKEHEHWVAKGWETEPVLDTLLAVGVSESPRVLTTLDNTKPRSRMDTIYTSETFQGLSSVDRKECSRMLARAEALLWRRTGNGTEESSSFGDTVLTNVASEEFQRNHPKLLECVRFVFEENKERVISSLGLSPGECAAMLYLQGSSTSDIDKYIDRDSEKYRTERCLSWENLKKAKQFWAALVKDCGAIFTLPDEERSTATTLTYPFLPLHRALGYLIEVQDGARSVEKVGVLSKAWNAWINSEELEFDVQPGTEPTGNLTLEYLTTESGERVLADDDRLTVGGIDCGDPGRKRKGDAILTPEQVEANKTEVRREAARKQEEIIQAARESKTVSGAGNLLTIEDELTLLRRDNPKCLLIFRGQSSSIAYDVDVPPIQKALGLKVDKAQSGMARCLIPTKVLEQGLKALRVLGHRIALIDRKDGRPVVEVLEAIPKAGDKPIVNDGKPPIQKALKTPVSKK